MLEENKAIVVDGNVDLLETKFDTECGRSDSSILCGPPQTQRSILTVSSIVTVVADRICTAHTPTTCTV